MTETGLPTKTQQLLAVALIITAGGISLSAMSQRSFSPERPAVTNELDFTTLRGQASDALAKLRRSRALDREATN